MVKSESVHTDLADREPIFTHPPLLTVEEVALFFRVKPSTVRKWAREGKIPQATKCGHGWRFHQSVLKEHLPIEPTDSTEHS